MAGNVINCVGIGSKLPFSVMQDGLCLSFSLLLSHLLIFERLIITLVREYKIPICVFQSANIIYVHRVLFLIFNNRKTDGMSYSVVSCALSVFSKWYVH